MKYLDFDLQVWRAGAAGGYVSSVQSPAGEAREDITPAFEELEALTDDFLGSFRRSSEVMRAPRGPGDPARALGGKLFRSFFTGEVLRRYDVSRTKATDAKADLRVRIRTADPELTVLPWELLYDERSGQHLALSATTPLIRYIDLPEPIAPIETPVPIRILGIVANPQDQPALNVHDEKQRVENALGQLTKRKIVQLDWLRVDTWRALQQKLRQGPWHVLHFIGHGRLDKAGEGALALSDETGRGTHWLSASVLANLASAQRFALVVLNSCEGARADASGAFTSSASVLVQRGVPAVVAMQRQISDRAAIEFARSFYEAAADGQSIEAAVTDARVAVQASSEKEFAEWSTPTLFMRAPNGQLFPARTDGRSQADPGDRREPVRPISALPLHRIPIMTVMGTKGGVGKGTIVACFAQLLAEAGRKVCIIDLDLAHYGTTRDAIRRFQKDNLAVRTVYDHLAPHAVGFEKHAGITDERLWDITPEYLTHRGSGRIWLLPATDSIVDCAFDVVANIKPPRENILYHVTGELIARARDQNPDVDVLIIDCGAGKDPTYSAAFASSDYGYIVTPPDVTCVEEILKIKREHIKRYPNGKVKVFAIVNRVTSEGDRERTRGCHPIGYIPRDPLLEEDNFRAPVDYDMGYDEVFTAVHGCLTASIAQRDAHLIPDEIDIRIRPWWNRLIEAGAAERTERSLAFRAFGLGYLAIGVAALAAMSLITYSAIKAGRIGVWSIFGLFGLLLLLLTGIAGIRSFVKRRSILRRLQALARHSEQDRYLMLDQLMEAAGRPELRWLNGISNQQQAEQRSKRKQSDEERTQALHSAGDEKRRAS